jgi:hypothetical protein
MQAYRHGARRVGLADDDGDMLCQAVLVAEHGDLALDGIRKRDARAAQKLQRVMAEPRRVMCDVTNRDRQYAGHAAAVVVETDQRRHEPAGFRELERSRRERRAARRRIDVECVVVDGCYAVDARERAQALEVRLGRKRDGDGAAQLARQGRGVRTLRCDEHDGAAVGCGDQPREQRRLQRFDRCYNEPAVTVDHLHGTATAQLVDGAVEHQRGMIAVDFLSG